MRFLIGAFVCSLCSGDEFPAPFNSEPESDKTLLSAKAAAAGFSVPEGVTVNVFACEPEVQNPIAMAWDARGRMWVAENFTYAERKVRFEEKLRDRVLIFEDSDRDGKADKRTVFLDDVQHLTSVEIDNKGIWLMCPPQLLFVPDANQDDIPDGKPEVVLDGFTVAEKNYHNFANGLRWGPDGWLYGRCGHSCPGMLGRPGTPEEERIPIDGGIWRYHPQRKVVEVLTHGTTNPWGHDWDEHGELFFINTVNGHLWHMIPGAHFKEPFGPSKNPLIYDRLEMHADHWHFDTSGHWTKSRAGKANDFGGGHAHIGMTIYQGGQFPKEWDGKLLTWNMHGRRLNRERLERHGSGYVAKHEPDQFLAKDPWFRGLEIQTGPDGSLYALDWSDTGECHDSTGVHRTSGRIYRFSYGKPEKVDWPDLEELTPASLTGFIVDKNAWHFRQGLRLMRGNWFRSRMISHWATDLLTKSIIGYSTTRRLRALWLLHATIGASRERLFGLSYDKNEHLRVWAIRLLSDEWKLDTLNGPQPPYSEVDTTVVKRFVKMAREDQSGLVRLALGSVLQRLPPKMRVDLAVALASRKEDAHDHNMPYVVWFGIYSLESDLTTIAEATEWPLLLRWIGRAIGEKGENLDAVLKIAQQEPTKAEAILTGLNEAFKGWAKVPKPATWNEISTILSEHENLKEIVTDLSVLFGDGRALEELRKHVLDKTLPLLARERALRTLIQKKDTGLRKLCETLLSQRSINRLAVQGLATINDPKVAGVILKHYKRHFGKDEREAVIGVLVSRESWAKTLLEQMTKGSIPRKDLTPFHARQILAFGNEKLKARLEKIWGKVRMSSKEKELEMAELKKEFTGEALAAADLEAGKKQFTISCAACHVMHGKGGKFGPDLTGSGRRNLDYLLENIVDPSAVVSANHRLTILTLKDGRVLSGIVSRETDEVITLQLLDEEKAVRKEMILEKKALETSLMPEGLLKTLTKEQRRDLIGYLLNTS